MGDIILTKADKKLFKEPKRRLAIRLRGYVKAYEKKRGKRLFKDELAYRAGLDRRTLSRIENGKGNPRFETLLRIFL